MTMPLSGCTFGWLHLAPLPDALRDTGFAGPTVYELVDGLDPEPRLPAGLATLAAAGWTP